MEMIGPPIQNEDLEGTRLGPESRGHLPDLTTADALAFTARLTRMQGVWIPDRVIFLDHGAIVEEGPPEQIFSQPERTRTRAFIADIAR